MYGLSVDVVSLFPIPIHRKTSKKERNTEKRKTEEKKERVENEKAARYKKRFHCSDLQKDSSWFYKHAKLKSEQRFFFSFSFFPSSFFPLHPFSHSHVTDVSFSHLTMKNEFLKREMNHAK